MINRFYKWRGREVHSDINPSSFFACLSTVKKALKFIKKKILCEFHVKELSRKFTKVCNNLIKWPYDSRKTHLGLSNDSPCVLWFAEEKNKKNFLNTPSFQSHLHWEMKTHERASTKKRDEKKVLTTNRSISRDKACSCNHQKSSLDFIFLLTLWKQRLVIRGDSFRSLAHFLPEIDFKTLDFSWFFTFLNFHFDQRR